MQKQTSRRTTTHPNSHDDMEMVKEAGADTPSTCRRPWRNHMSVLLKTVTRQSSCLIQKRPRQ